MKQVASIPLYGIALIKSPLEEVQLRTSFPLLLSYSLLYGQAINSSLQGPFLKATSSVSVESFPFLSGVKSLTSIIPIAYTQKLMPYIHLQWKHTQTS